MRRFTSSNGFLWFWYKVSILFLCRYQMSSVALPGVERLEDGILVGRQGVANLARTPGEVWGICDRRIWYLGGASRLLRADMKTSDQGRKN